MKFHTVKESEQAYLILDEYPVPESDYPMKMAESCGIRGLIPCSVLSCDGTEMIRFNVTGLVSLSSRYTDTPLHYQDICSFLYSLRNICQQLPAFLLSSEDLLLDPKGIFLSPGTGNVHLCYIPGLAGTEPAIRNKLAEFLLKHTDHDDQTAAKLAYAFYGQASEDTCILSSALTDILNGFSAQTENPVKPAMSELMSDRPPVHEDLSPPPLTEDDFAVFSNQNPTALQRDIGIAASDFSSLNKPSGPRHRRLSGPNSADKKQDSSRKLLVVLITAAVFPGVCATLILRLDAAQIGGIGFLSAAVIWLIWQRRSRKKSDLHNIWSDEEEELEEDDSFYQSLLKDVYAQNPRSSPAGRSSYSPDVPLSGAADDSGFAVFSGFAGSSGSSGSFGFAGSSGSSRSSGSVGLSGFDGSSGSSVLFGSVPSAGPQPSSCRKKAPAHGPSHDTAAAVSARNPVRPSSSEEEYPALVSEDPGHFGSIPLRKNILIIGKSPRECDVCLKVDTVSRLHAKIEQTGNGFYLTDLFSTNGTYLDGQVLEPNHPRQIRHGSDIRFADCRFKAVLPQPCPPSQSVPAGEGNPYNSPYAGSGNVI